MRSIWSGSISFGLINIPVKVYSAAEDRGLKFRLLDKHGLCPISYARVCRHDNREIPYKDIVKGYEYQKGDYVILTDEDFIKAAPKKTKTIGIMHFAKENEIPSKHIEKPYFLEPDTKAEKAYVLLREALKRSKKVGIGTWVLRNKEHLAMIRPEDKALSLVQLRFASDLRSPEGLRLPAGSAADFSKRELDMALSLIEQLTTHFNAEEFKDTYTEALEAIITNKAKGKPVKVTTEAEPAATNMRDLMKMLQQSLKEAQATAA